MPGDEAFNYLHKMEITRQSLTHVDNFSQAGMDIFLKVINGISWKMTVCKVEMEYYVNNVEDI